MSEEETFNYNSLDYWEELEERSSGNYSPYDYLESIEASLKLDEDILSEWEWE
jgi:hypothetical protein